MDSLESRRRNRGHADRLVSARAPSTRLGRQHGHDSLPRTGGVVLGGPSGQRHDIRRYERLRVEQLANRLDLRFIETGCRHADVDDDPGDDAGPEGHDDARADSRRGDVSRNAIRQEIERGNGDGDADQQRENLELKTQNFKGLRIDHSTS